MDSFSNALTDASAFTSEHLAVMNPATFNWTEFTIVYFQRNAFMSIIGIASFIGVVAWWEYVNGLFDFEWRKSTDKSFALQSHTRFV